ncbi:MAG: SO_0444 family Cu/Zn efflux transporter [Thermodesulfobacteriota bacterium]
MLDFIVSLFTESWDILADAAPYVLVGLVTGGLLKVFISPAAVARNLGQGRFKPVFKAALIGVPLPLCSCGVLPAAAAIKKQGANNGATTAFLISTPESGVDSIAISYALLDPILTVARPLAALVSATLAGVAENLLGPARGQALQAPDLACPVDGCCDGVDCPPHRHARHHSLRQKLRAGLGFALGELWDDLAAWFLLGILLAGLVGVLVPADVLGAHLGGGLGAMLLMLVFATPLYICASASTPIAAALIIKGVSPGAALVFLLAGPATNLASLTVLAGVLGRRATAIYLASIALCAVILGLILDQVYVLLGVSPAAALGQAAELAPAWLRHGAALLLLGLSARPLWRRLSARLARLRGGRPGAPALADACAKPT